MTTRAVLAGPNAEMSVARLNGDQGLSPGSVMSIQQDAQGFIWLGTEDGVDRYDGYEIRNYLHKRGAADSLPNNWVSALATDTRGRLWIGTDGGGLVWLDSDSGSFKRITTHSGDPLLSPTLRIRALLVDKQQRIWVATRSTGVHLVEPDLRRTREFRSSGTEPSLSDDSAFAIAEDSSGRIWIGGDQGLDGVDPRSWQREHYGKRLAEAFGAPTASIKVNALRVDAHGHLWIGTDAGLARLDTSAGTLNVLRHRAGDERGLPSDRVTSLLEDDEQRLWVGTAAGLAHLDRRTGRFTTYRHDPTDSGSLPDNYIVSLYQDRSGLLWVGTKSGGVARWNPRSWSLGHRRISASGDDNVTSFGVDRHGALWVGLFGTGLISIDPQSASVTRYRRNPGSRGGLLDDNIMALVVDDSDRIWLGTMGAGVIRFDPATGVFRQFGSDPSNERALPAAGIMSLLRDSRGHIWVGTYGGGIARIDPSDDSVMRYPGKSDEPQLSSERATALAEDRSGLIWVGTDGGGLIVLDPTSGRQRRFRHDSSNADTLSADTVYALHMDDTGSIWIGTRGGGLERAIGAPFGPASLRFVHIAESEGLPNGTVYGIESDGSGKLWVSTNRGLAVVTSEGQVVRTFRHSHGLQGDEFNFGAHYRGPDGTMFFGGANGYNAFQPQQVRTNDLAPPIVLTEVLKLNVPMPGNPEGLRDLSLGFRENAVTFRFSALDFTGPSENRYAYQLEGFDEAWVEAGSVRQATYTNLAGGHYVFRVRAANSDGKWNHTGIAVNIRVQPPPWNTWWARMLYVFAFVAAALVAWSTHRRRLNRESAYAQRLKTEVDLRTAELADRNRQLHESSISDPLTGLGNRRHLRDTLSALRADADRCRGVVLIIDLDYLKPINDKYGHEAGDALITQFADILRRVFRSTDVLVRWGGDEFVVFCPSASLSTASELTERLRSSVAKQIFSLGSGRVTRSSCSIGFAPVPHIEGLTQPFDWEISLQLADAALYRAKRDRNMWVGWGGTPRAKSLDLLIAAVTADADRLEREGYLDVRRPCNRTDDTVDTLQLSNVP